MTLGVVEGYEVHVAVAWQGFVWSAGADWLAATLAGGTTLHEWAAGHDRIASSAGRGTVHAVPAPTLGPDGRECWAVRHYRRGGSVARYLDDRYLAGGDSRPVRELKASVEARKRGVPTPAVMAGATYSAGIFYRADIATELIPDAKSLRDVLFGAAQARSMPRRLFTSLGRWCAGWKRLLSCIPTSTQATSCFAVTSAGPRRT